jgi:hypothetical protein
MKRGIPIALQAAGTVLACLVTTLNHPVVANEQTVNTDTVHYYNKRGREIFCNTEAGSAGNYVIRTSKTRRQVFDDWYSRYKGKSSGKYNPAHVFNIECKEARKARKLIRRGLVDDTLVKKCFVAILDKGSIKKMYDSIQVGRKGDTLDKKFREYGGMINNDTTFICKRGKPTNPRQPENEGLYMDVGVRGNFHSHPEGEVSDLIDNKIYTYFFVSGPSLDDEEILKERTGYVFGMRKDCRLIYIFDGRGVLAILPFKFLPSKAVKK